MITETLRQIPCSGHTHASVTEVEVCAEIDAHDEWEYRSEQAAEKSMMAFLEGGWDHPGEYVEDSFAIRF